ncbi:sulfatase-like hydrolase/transferase [Aestuariibaculum marinum]|nr:sulfatase-like hydrolase/transferase [Aestuariibaculum marinum]
MPFVVWSQHDEKPNIIVILADDLGWGDVGYHGSEIHTPHINQLAKEGLRMERFYVTPICSPTRAGLLTGRYPERYGLRSTVIPPWRDFGVDTSEVFLPEKLSKVGYTNRAVLGKWHLGHSRMQYHPLHRGFTHFYGHYNGAIDFFTHFREGELDWHDDFNSSYDEGYSTDLLTQEAIQNIKEYSAEGDPFFMYVAYNAPHVPLQAKEEDLIAQGYDASKPKFSDEKGYGYQGRGNTVKQTYNAMVSSLDKGIGEILAALEENNIEKNTIVLFFSDNGPDPGSGGSSGGLRGTKFEEWEGGVRVPAIIKWPSKIKGGEISNQVTGYIDVMPTLLDIVGVKEESKLPLDGISILPVLKGQKPVIHREFYLGSKALVNTEWKLIKSDGSRGMRLENDVLFHLISDPSEKLDVRQQYPLVYKKMMTAIEKFENIHYKTEVRPYGEGRKGFKAPKEWKIE